MDRVPARLAIAVTTTKIEWTLAFAFDDVVSRLQAMLGKAGYEWTRVEGEGQVRFEVRPAGSRVTFVARRLRAKPAPFGSGALFQQTALIVAGRGLSLEQEAVLKRQLTLSFLRVGG